MRREPIYWFVIALAATSMLLVLWTWLSKLTGKLSDGRAVHLSVLIAPTISGIWYFVALKYPVAIGSYYSAFRQVVIYANFLAMGACSLLALLHGRRYALLGIGSILQTAVWFFTLIGNTAVA